MFRGRWRNGTEGLPEQLSSAASVESSMAYRHRQGQACRAPRNVKTDLIVEVRRNEQVFGYTRKGLY